MKILVYTLLCNLTFGDFYFVLRFKILSYLNYSSFFIYFSEVSYSIFEGSAVVFILEKENSLFSQLILVTLTVLSTVFYT